MSRFRGEVPNIGPWRKGEPLADDRIGGGWESETLMHGGVRRKVFTTEEGMRVFADKPMKSGAEAKRAYEIYAKMKKAGLPVVDFLKVVREKDAQGATEYRHMMEDLTENGKLEIVTLEAKSKGHPGSQEIIKRSSHPQALREQMIRALAVMHNNELVNFHPVLSFVLRRDPKTQDIVDFKIIDYSNFTGLTLPSGMEGNFDFESNRKYELIKFLTRIAPFAGDEVKTLRAEYERLREDKVMHY